MEIKTESLNETLRTERFQEALRVIIEELIESERIFPTEKKGYIFRHSAGSPRIMIEGLEIDQEIRSGKLDIGLYINPTESEKKKKEATKKRERLLKKHEAILQELASLSEVED